LDPPLYEAPKRSVEDEDGFNTRQIARLIRKHFDRNRSEMVGVVYVDIGGLSGSAGLLESICCYRLFQIV